jgi:hypothetical protein
MTAHNAIIYHCLTCGSVVHAEPEAEPPHCCGCEMEKAATAAVRQEDVSRMSDASHCETAPPLPRVRKKPR